MKSHLCDDQHSVGAGPQVGWLFMNERRLGQIRKAPVKKLLGSPVSGLVLVAGAAISVALYPQLASTDCASCGLINTMAMQSQDAVSVGADRTDRNDRGHLPVSGL